MAAVCTAARVSRATPPRSSSVVVTELMMRMLLELPWMKKLKVRLHRCRAIRTPMPTAAMVRARSARICTRTRMSRATSTRRLRTTMMVETAE